MSKKTFLDFNTAIKKGLEITDSTKLKEMVSLSEALGRVVASDIICVKNLPAFNNSAMDGFAFKASDLGKTLSVAKTIFAGDKGESVKEVLKEGECYKIMTGAKVPNDADTIAPIEICEVLEDGVKLPDTLKKGANLRLKGEEQKEGNTLFKKGEKITSSHITLLASQGIMMVEVFKKISIIVVSTGNELKEPWESSDEEEIYNCNSYALISLLKEHGFDASYGGVIPDRLEESKEFIKGLNSFDVIITTGGISMGDADFVGQAFLQNGLETAFHGVNIKPGKPIMMGKMQNSTVFCLPGNPLTAIVNMRLFGLTILKKLQGLNNYFLDVTFAMNKQEFKTKAGRVNVVLGKVQEGSFKVTRQNKYGSGMITALYESNCILVTKEETEKIDAGQEVYVIDFDSVGSCEEGWIFN